MGEVNTQTVLHCRVPGGYIYLFPGSPKVCDSELPESCRGAVRRQGVRSKITILVTNQVPMAPHSTILCHNEAQHLHEAFEAPPKPERPNFRQKKIKNISKIRKNAKLFYFPVWGLTLGSFLNFLFGSRAFPLGTQTPIL